MLLGPYFRLSYTFYPFMVTCLFYMMFLNEDIFRSRFLQHKVNSGQPNESAINIKYDTTFSPLPRLLLMVCFTVLCTWLPSRDKNVMFSPLSGEIKNQNERSKKFIFWWISRTRGDQTALLIRVKNYPGTLAIPTIDANRAFSFYSENLFPVSICRLKTIQVWWMR